MSTPKPPDDKAHKPAPVDLSEESVAGEEDPGAAFEDVEDPPQPRPAPPAP
jgi:hypothetical protein